MGGQGGQETNDELVWAQPESRVTRKKAVAGLDISQKRMMNIDGWSSFLDEQSVTFKEGISFVRGTIFWDAVS